MTQSPPLLLGHSLPPYKQGGNTHNNHYGLAQPPPSKQPLIQNNLEMYRYNVQIMPLKKLLLTVVAAERFYPSMNSQVYTETGTLIEGYLSVVAAIGFLPCMKCKVFLKIKVRKELRYM